MGFIALLVTIINERNSMSTKPGTESPDKKEMGIGKFVGIIGLTVVGGLSAISLIQIDANNTEAKNNEVLASYGFQDIHEATDFNGDTYTSAENQGIYYKVKVTSEPNGKKSVSAVVDPEQMNGGVQSVEVEKDYSEYGTDLTKFQKGLIDDGWGFLVKG